MVEAIIALVALSAMEIVLGIDNIVFITLATGHLPPEQQSAGRRWGLVMALVTRLLLLCGIYWIAHLSTTFLTLSDYLPSEGLQQYFMVSEDDGLGGHGLSFGTGAEGSADEGEAEPPQLDEEAWKEFDEISYRDLILLAGGLFLIWSSVKEIHQEVEGEEEFANQSARQRSFVSVIIQIAIFDIIFSLDSVITAVGMANQLWVMCVAMIIAVGVMILFANQVGDFVEANPTIKMLALSFLLLIGVMLVAEGIGTPISKGYIYFAMVFSLLVEMFNMRIRTRKEAVASES